MLSGNLIGEGSFTNKAMGQKANPSMTMLKITKTNNAKVGLYSLRRR
jgi:hypothetical protein